MAKAFVVGSECIVLNVTGPEAVALLAYAEHVGHVPQMPVSALRAARRVLSALREGTEELTRKDDRRRALARQRRRWIRHDHG